MRHDLKKNVFDHPLEAVLYIILQCNMSKVLPQNLSYRFSNFFFYSFTVSDQYLIQIHCFINWNRYVCSQSVCNFFTVCKVIFPQFYFRPSSPANFSRLKFAHAKLYLKTDIFTHWNLPTLKFDNYQQGQNGAGIKQFKLCFVISTCDGRILILLFVKKKKKFKSNLITKTLLIATIFK